MGSIAACEADPETTGRANVTGTIRLAKRLLASRTRITFLSSNAVFDGNSPHLDENSERCPSTEYGRQKAAVEQALLSLSNGVGRISIVRLAKTLSTGSGMAAEFLRHLAAGESCRAFDDLTMAPISVDYVVRALREIAANEMSGIFHLSGAEEMSYADFARRLANHIGASESLVRPCVSADAGVKVLFRPANPALGMARTRQLLQIEPEPIEHLLTSVAGPKK